jgi:hypothetical protein
VARTLSNVSAHRETGEVPDPTGQGRRRNGPTGRVELRGVPDWMSSRQMVTASLSPAEARVLAADLLVAAEQAEGQHRHR